MKVITIQISIFGNYHDITPTNNRFSVLSKALPSFLPNTQQILNVQVDSGVAKFEPRISLLNNDDRITIDFQADRIDASYAPGEATLSEEETSAKIDKCLEYINDAYVAIPAKERKNAKRLALSIQFVECEGDTKPDWRPYINDETDEDLFEWSVMKNVRGNIEFDGKSEIINQATQYSLGISNNTPTTKYAILKLIDYNTAQEQTEERFDADKIRGFLEKIKEKVIEKINLEVSTDNNVQ